MNHNRSKLNKKTPSLISLSLIQFYWGNMSIQRLFIFECLHLLIPTQSGLTDFLLSAKFSTCFHVKQVEFLQGCYFGINCSCLFHVLKIWIFSLPHFQLLLTTRTLYEWTVSEGIPLFAPVTFCNSALVSNIIVATIGFHLPEL